MKEVHIQIFVFRADRTACSICYSALSPGLGLGTGDADNSLVGKRAITPTSLVLYMFNCLL